MPTRTRTPRPLPPTWKAPAHPPTLPASYPPLLPLVTLSPAALELALRAPGLSAPVQRARNAHLILAQRGDAYLRVVLLQIGAELGLTLAGRHHLVSIVGANATLAQIALESGVLDAAMAQRTRANGVCCKAAAGIFEALAAAMEDEMGLRAAAVLKIALFPWVAAAVVAKVVPAVRVYEGGKAAIVLQGAVARMMEEVMASGVSGVNGVNGKVYGESNGVNCTKCTKDINRTRNTTGMSANGVSGTTSGTTAKGVNGSCNGGTRTIGDVNIKDKTSNGCTENIKDKTSNGCTDAS